VLGTLLMMARLTALSSGLVSAFSPMPNCFWHTAGIKNNAIHIAIQKKQGDSHHRYIEIYESGLRSIILTRF